MTKMLCIRRREQLLCDPTGAASQGAGLRSGLFPLSAAAPSHCTSTHRNQSSPRATCFLWKRPMAQKAKPTVMSSIWAYVCVPCHRKKANSQKYYLIHAYWTELFSPAWLFNSIFPRITTSVYILASLCQNSPVPQPLMFCTGLGSVDRERHAWQIALYSMHLKPIS